MPKTLEAHDKLIREIFEGAYQFKIPDYRDAAARTSPSFASGVRGIFTARVVVDEAPRPSRRAVRHRR
jgi:hypothetical protein